MALKMINFMLIFLSLSLLSISQPIDLVTSALDGLISIVTDMVHYPISYNLTYQLPSFKSFSVWFIATCPSSNTSCNTGRCGTHNDITYWYRSSGIIIIIGTVLAVINIGFITHLIWMNKGNRDNSDGPDEQNNESNLSPIMNRVKIYTGQDLEIATSGFIQENLITEGDYCAFFKGCLPDSREVVIKCYTKRDHIYELAFQTELDVLTEVHHDNVTKLIGYCTESDERLLIFEYMNNGTLHDHLSTNFQPDSPFNTWKLRIKILLDCARGIECLHKHAGHGIMHRNITPFNILLDENWNACISEFELALAGPELGTERVDVKQDVGAIGYRDPDCNIATRSVTLKCDVYSFGVVIIEVITATCAYDEYSDTMYADYIAPKIIAGKLPLYLDRRPNFPFGVDARAVHLIGQLSERCIRRSTVLRPTMSEVVQEIERIMSLYD